jgi:hypothetical protein
MAETLWSVVLGHQVLFSAKSKELNFFPKKNVSTVFHLTSHLWYPFYMTVEHLV